MAKLKLVNTMSSQKMGEKVTGFYNTTKEVGTESKGSVYSKFGLSDEQPTAPKYITIGGVPHKLVNGVFVSLTKI